MIFLSLSLSPSLPLSENKINKILKKKKIIALWNNMWTSPENVPYKLEKIGILLFGGGVFCIHLSSVCI